MKNLFIKCDQIRRKLKKSVMENFFIGTGSTLFSYVCREYLSEFQFYKYSEFLH